MVGQQKKKPSLLAHLKAPRNDSRSASCRCELAARIPRCSQGPEQALNGEPGTCALRAQAEGAAERPQGTAELGARGGRGRAFGGYLG